MATMESNNAAIAAMQQMLQERCIAEPTLAIKLANPKKSLESAINYLCHEIQKSGLCVVDDQTVLSILLHFYDEDSIEDGGTPINCNIVVSKPDSKSRRWSNTRRSNSEKSDGSQLRRLNPSRLPPLPKPEQKSMFNPIFLTSKTPRR